MSAWRFVSAAWLIVACCWSSSAAWGQTNLLTDPLEPAPLTKEQIEKPPQREVKVEQVAEPETLRFDRPYPPLAEQRYIALLKFELPPPERPTRRPPEFPVELQPAEYLGNLKVLTGERSGYANDLRASFAAYLQTTPDDLVPKEAREFFLSGDIDGGFVKVSSINTARDLRFRPASRVSTAEESKPTLTISVYGKSVAECEQRARALLTMLDYGFSRALQLELLKQRDDAAKRFAARQTEARTLSEELPRLKKSLEAFADLSNEMLTGLQLQQREAEIALAGVKSRLAAAERLLASAEKEGAAKPRLDQLLEIKLAAEIDAADWEARQGKAIELVGKVKARIELAAKLTMSEQRLPELQASVRNYRTTALYLDQDLKRHAPLALVDQKILIRPIEWSTP